MARVASNVSHIDVDAHAVPVKVFGQLAADFVSVDIAINGAQRPEGLEDVQGLRVRGHRRARPRRILRSS